MEEHFFSCPYCSQLISILVDKSVLSQTYIEDCEVCCNPMEISLKIEHDNIMEFNAHSIGQ